MTITSSLPIQTNPRTIYPIVVMTTNANAVTAGGNTPGWVSGDPRNMPISTTVNVVFDLGPDWSMYSELQITIAPGWTAGTITYDLRGADTTVFNSNARRLVPKNYGGASTTLFYAVTAVSGQGAFTRPLGRYVIINCISNGTGTTDTTAYISLAMYPGV